MASKAEGKLCVLVWSDDGVIKPVVLDTGMLPVTESNPLTAIDVTLAASDITLDIKESVPLTELDVTIKASDITVPVAEQSPITSLYAKQWGYWGGAWRNQPLIWGYTDRILTQVVNASADTGQNNLMLGAVPAGQIWVIEGLAVVNNTSIPTVVRFGVHDGSSWYWFDAALTPAAATYSFWAGSFRLKTGDSVGTVLMGCTAGDYLFMNVSGYKMQIS